MAIATVITRGYGNGTFSGTIPLVTLHGYGVGASTDQVIALWHNLTLTSYDTNTSGADTVPMQTRNVDMAQVIQAGVDPT